MPVSSLDRNTTLIEDFLGLSNEMLGYYEIQIRPGQLQPTFLPFDTLGRQLEFMARALNTNQAE
jgi:hypothetical protein